MLVAATPRKRKISTSHVCMAWYFHKQTGFNFCTPVDVYSITALKRRIWLCMYVVRQKDLNALKRAVTTMLIYYRKFTTSFNPLNPELNPICYLLALLGAHHFLHVSRIRVKLLTFRRLMSYIYVWSTHS